MTAERLDIWSHASAFFNGDTVTVELVAAPGTSRNRLVIDAVMVGQPRGTDRGSCGICDFDDRLPSTDPNAGRLWPVGCSATIYNEDSCFVTAGHCLQEANAILVQFNVPASNPDDCDTNNPPVADQFPVISKQWRTDGPGADWGIGTLGPNDLDQTPFERYGTFRPIAGAPANIGQTADIFGYGLDLSECERNQTQQHVSGQIIGRSGG